MGRLGYQSDAQARAGGQLQQPGNLRRLAARRADAALCALRGHRHQATSAANTTSWPPRLLQIENEFYGTIRPKRVIHPGERPLHALRERGVEYVEVRCMDLDPFVPVGITASTMRFLDVFLLHCLLQRQPAGHARRDGRTGTQPAPHGGLRPRARADAGPSARVLSAMQRDFEGNFTAFVRAQSDQARNHLLALPWAADQQAAFERAATDSVARRRAIEAADTVDFETWRVAYLAPERLRV
jgi:glutamate--cysteine ligase